MGWTSTGGIDWVRGAGVEVRGPRSRGQADPAYLRQAVGDAKREQSGRSKGDCGGFKPVAKQSNDPGERWNARSSGPALRFVAVKREDQRAAAMACRARNPLIRRTQTINALRAQLAEQGIVAPPRETFAGGRDFAAWVCLAPRQPSSDGKARLGGLHSRTRRTALGSHGFWRTNQKGRVAVTLTNPMARTPWAFAVALEPMAPQGLLAQRCGIQRSGDGDRIGEGRQRVAQDVCRTEERKGRGWRDRVARSLARTIRHRARPGGLLPICISPYRPEAQERPQPRSRAHDHA